jgi:glycosyltransferase involved in cell wall biosynthesis
LTEAIKCGVKCLVSDIDPIAEILNNEKYGILVKHPNFVKSWIETIEKILSNEIVFNKYDANEVYRMDEWISNIKRLSS